MGKDNKYNVRTLYFTDKLKKRMDTLLDFPCTVVEAPMGYGKTTAVREAIRCIDAKVLWQNIYDNDTFDFWQGFCQSFHKLDMDFEDSLSKMGMPTDWIIRREMISLIEATTFTSHTFLIIDDYHFIKSKEVDEFLAFFIRNLPEKLHVIVITRLEFLKSISELQLKGFINHIGIDTLEFEKSDITKYYSLCGIHITEEEENLIYAHSEGWISALYLLMLEYNMYGSFNQTKDIPSLVGETVYIPLSDELKSFLNFVCIFDKFTLKQAKDMWLKDNAEELLIKLLSNNAFIKKDYLTETYQFHNIFRAYVKGEFSKKPEEIQKKIWERAGEWYLKNNEYLVAMEFFYKCKDFDNLLVALVNEKDYRLEGDYKNKFLKYIVECPENVKVKNHFARIFYTRRLFILNEIDLFQSECAKVLKGINEDKTLDKDSKDALLGEYEIAISFAQYNDIGKMADHLKKACSLLKSNSKIFDSIPNWTFGSTSIIAMFYRESGKLSNHLDILKEAMQYYYKVTDNHGFGAEYVMEAETYFMKGEFEDSEISLYKALERATSNDQWSIILCARFLQMLIALNKGDYALVNELLINTENILKVNKRYTLLYTFEVCVAYIYSLLGQPQKIHKWILQGDFSNRKLPFPSMPSVQLVYGRALLENGEYLKLIGLSEMFLKIASIFPNLLCQVYIHIHLCGAYEKIHNRNKAMEHLKIALDIAMPDSLYIPFVENGKYIRDIIYDGNMGREYKEMFYKFHELYEKYNIAVSSICKEHFSDKSPWLTEREVEVAELAVMGFSNKEIAKKLYITENTVKSRLKIIFKKLSIKSRAQIETHIHKN